MFLRAVRGAITVENNDADEILQASQELLIEMVDRNAINIDDITSIFFSMTTDLNAVYPAASARNLGWTSVPLMCTNEINVPGSLKKCVRIMLYFNTEKKNTELMHIYLRKARVLRPDLSSNRN